MPKSHTGAYILKLMQIFYRVYGNRLCLDPRSPYIKLCHVFGQSPTPRQVTYFLNGPKALFLLYRLKYFVIFSVIQNASHVSDESFSNSFSLGLLIPDRLIDYC